MEMEKEKNLHEYAFDYKKSKLNVAKAAYHVAQLENLHERCTDEYVLKLEQEMEKIANTNADKLFYEDFYHKLINLDEKYNDIDPESNEGKALTAEIIASMYEELEAEYKLINRKVAEYSVVDALKNSKFTKKQAERIDKIVKMHDPDAIQSAIKDLSNDPEFTSLLEDIERDAVWTAKNTPKTVSGIIRTLFCYAPFVAGIVGLIGIATGRGNNIAHHTWTYTCLASVVMPPWLIKNDNKLFREIHEDYVFKCLEKDERPEYIDRHTQDVQYVYNKIMAKRDSKLLTSLAIDMILDRVETIEKTGSFSKK